MPPRRWARPVGLAAALAVDDGGAVGRRPDAPRGVGVVAADLAVGRVAVDHGIHVARRHRPEQVGLAQRLEGLGTLPVGLRDDADAKTLGFEQCARSPPCRSWGNHVTHQPSISSLLALTLAACGGGGSSSDIATTSSTTNVPTTAPASAASLAQQCAPDNPYRGDASTAHGPERYRLRSNGSAPTLMKPIFGTTACPPWTRQPRILRPDDHAGQPQRCRCRCPTISSALKPG